MKWGEITTKAPMSENDLLNSLGRASEGVALALKNRDTKAEMIANLEYAKANIDHILREAQ